MKAALRTLAALAFVVSVALLAYAAKGWWDAAGDAPRLAQRADALIRAGRGGADLGPGRLAWLLTVEDPGFLRHSGMDMSTAGAGATTLTQSLSKRLAFAEFRPGIRKIRQTAYAMSLERRLSKEQIVALFLDTVPMGRGPAGRMIGFYRASEAVYGKAPSALSDEQYLSLVAVMIAPSRLSVANPGGELRERVARLRRLVRGQCSPETHNDVWLKGCAR